MIHLHWYTLLLGFFLTLWGGLVLGALLVEFIAPGKLCDWISDSKSTLWLKR